MNNKPLKVTLVGDGNVGKTSLCLKKFENKSPSGHKATVFEEFNILMNIKDQNYNVKFWDTAGQECYDKLRTIPYANTNAFMLCYDISNPQSRISCETKWMKDIREYSNAPILLVGTKMDLSMNDILNSMEAEMLLKKLKLSKYVLTSSETGEGVEEAFVTATLMASKRNQKCVIL